MAEDFISELGLAFTAHRLRRLSDELVEACGGWFSMHGLNAPPRAASTLRLLQREPLLSVTQIAVRLRLSHPFIVRLVAELERLGLVRLFHDAQDARRRLVELTPSGAGEACAFAASAETLAEAYRTLGRDAGVDLLATLEAVERALRELSFDQRLSLAAAVGSKEGTRG